MDYPEIGEVFHDAAKDDPYGVFVNIVAEAFLLAEYREAGAMNEHEASIVYGVRNLIVEKDPAAASLFRSVRAMSDDMETWVVVAHGCGEEFAYRDTKEGNEAFEIEALYHVVEECSWAPDTMKAAAILELVERREML